MGLGPLRKSRVISPQTLNLNHIYKDLFPPKSGHSQVPGYGQIFWGGATIQLTIGLFCYHQLCPFNSLSLNILTCEMGTESLTFLSHGFAEIHTFP